MICLYAIRLYRFCRSVLMPSLGDEKQYKVHLLDFVYSGFEEAHHHFRSFKHMCILSIPANHHASCRLLAIW